MLNYLYSELWRVFRRPLGRAYFLICIGLPALFNLMVAVVNWTARWAKPLYLNEAILPITAVCPLLGACFLIPVADFSFGDENRLGTFKNAVGFGISRSLIYWGKFISSVLLSLISLGLLLAAFFLTGLLLPRQSEYMGKVIQELFVTIFYSLPLWLGILATLHMFYFVFRNGILAVVGAMVGLPPALIILAMLGDPVLNGLNWILEHSIVQLMLDVVMAPTRSLLPGFEGLPGLAYVWVISLVHMAVFLLPGYFVFLRKEIK